MNPVPAHTPLKVAAYGFAPRLVQTLRLFFQGPCGGRCLLVPEAQAELVLVDIDSPEGAGRWRQTDPRNPDRPMVAVALRRPEPAPPWFLSKPIGSRAFLELLDRLEPRLRNADASALTVPSAAITTPPGGKRGKTRSFRQATRSASTAKAARTLEAASFRHFIRSVPDADPGDLRQRGHSTYDPRRHLQGHLQQACARAAASGKAQRLRGPWRDILIFPDTGEVIADLDEARLRSMTVIPVDGHGQVLLSELTAEEAEALRSASAGTPERQETFLWKVALWSSRGRLPGDSAWETPVRLRHWPNLTRLVLTPHALQLAALWVRRRCSPLEAAAALQLPRPAVFAFYSAALAVGLMEHEPGSVPLSQPVRPLARGLLGRILGRLRGA